MFKIIYYSTLLVQLFKLWNKKRLLVGQSHSKVFGSPVQGQSLFHILNSNYRARAQSTYCCSEGGGPYLRGSLSATACSPAAPGQAPPNTFTLLGHLKRRWCHLIQFDIKIVEVWSTAAVLTVSARRTHPLQSPCLQLARNQKYALNWHVV